MKKKSIYKIWLSLFIFIGLVIVYIIYERNHTFYLQEAQKKDEAFIRCVEPYFAEILKIPDFHFSNKNMYPKWYTPEPQNLPNWLEKKLENCWVFDLKLETNNIITFSISEHQEDYYILTCEYYYFPTENLKTFQESDFYNKSYEDLTWNFVWLTFTPIKEHYAKWCTN